MLQDEVYFRLGILALGSSILNMKLKREKRETEVSIEKSLPQESIAGLRPLDARRMP